MSDKSQIIKVLVERSKQYESTDKDYFIAQLLEMIDVNVLKLIAREQGIDVDS